MSSTRDALIVRPDEAEYVFLPHGGGFGLLVDGGQTEGAVGANRLVLPAGADGARPHYHASASELFYVLDGVMEFLLGESVATVERGGTVVVPPRLPHAFGAARGVAAELLVLMTPGIDRFEYFRMLARVQQGLQPFEAVLPEQERYDVHFTDDRVWRPASR